MSRIEEIVYDLMKIDDYVTTKDLAEIFGVSDRTIRSDLNKVEMILPYYGMTLDRKPGVGIKLIGTKEKKDNFIVENVQLTLNHSDIYSPSGRVLYILVELLLQKNTVHIEYLTSQLFVSRTTVQNDLILIEEWLNERNLKLVRRDNKGLIIEGEESKIRETISDILTQKDRKLEILNESEVDESILKQLNKLVDFDVNVVKEIVESAEREYKIKFSYESLNNLTTHISITIMRINDNKGIELPTKLINQISKSKEFEIAQYIANLISNEIKKKIPINEVYYLALHVIGATFENNLIDQLEIDYQGVNVRELAHKMTIEFLEIIERILLMKLSDNERLVEGLTLHLIPTINRIEYDLKLYNPILDDIKMNYSSIFIISWNMNLLFDKYLGKTVGEDEIAYITLHVAAAIESTKEKKRVAVVCTSGIGASRLLKARLEKEFSDFEIINYSVREIDDLENIDFILSTVSLDTDEPYLVINTILNEHEIKRIKKFLNIYYQRSSEELFYPDDLHYIEGNLSKEDLLLMLTRKSLFEGFVKEGFLESIYDREMITSTEVGDGIVLTHGYPEFVKQSRVVIAVLKNRIKWNEEMINIIVIPIMSEEDIKNKTYQLDWFYRSLSEENFVDELSLCKSSEEIKMLLVRKMNE